MAIESTIIKKISDSELDSLLVMGENVIVSTNPTEEIAKAEAEALAKKQAEEAAAEEAAANKKKTELEAEKLRLKSEGKSEEEIEELLKFGEEEGEEEENENSNEDDDIKGISSSVLKVLIEDKLLFPFEAEEGKAEKPIEQYTKKEQIELIKANIERIQEEEREKAPIEFFDNLSPELQIAAAYEAKGGKDLKALFHYLAQSQEIKELDIKKPEDQEKIVRQWSAFTGFTPEEIEEEITSLKDLPGALEKKANLYKPKLDAKQEELINKQLKEQELRAKNAEQIALKYRENVIKMVNPGVINGIKIDQNTKGMIYNGLVKADYPSMSGRNTNLLGHLLEKYQAVEPNLELIAEVLWLLNDPKSYKEAIKTLGSSEASSKTARTLKTASSEKTSNANNEIIPKPSNERKTVKKPTRIFSRT